MLLMQHTQTSFSSTGVHVAESNALQDEDSDVFEDLKLLDFPIYDDNFDDTSLDEMFSPSSSFEPQASAPATPTTCSSYAPSPSPLAITTSPSDADIIMTTVCQTPVSDAPSPSGSAILPSFLETYSPRYRPPPPAMFFKFEDMAAEADISQTSSSFSIPASTPLSADSPIPGMSGSVANMMPFLKQEAPDHLDPGSSAHMPDIRPLAVKTKTRMASPFPVKNQCFSGFTSPATVSSGRSSVSSMSDHKLCSRTSLSSASSSSTHSTMSPPLTPITPPSQRARRSAPTEGQCSDSRPQSSLCAVCGDNAACQHYGVRTCEGCKGFFKRTVQKGAKYVCLGSKDCVVDKRRRNRCQFCRFQKCLSVGMVKEVVRTDELKGRRGRLPSKPKSPQQSPPSPPISTITALVRACLDTSPDPTSMHGQQVDGTMTCDDIDEESVHLFYRTLESSLDVIRCFCNKTPGFVDLEKRDQEILFQSALVELFVLRFSYRNNADTERLMFCSGTILERRHVELMMGSRWLSAMDKLSVNLRNMDVDISAFACLCALALVADRPGLRNSSRVDQLQSKIISSLRDHCTYNSEAQKKINYFSRILSILPELRNLSVEGVKRMQRLDQVIPLPDSLKTHFSSASSSLLC